MTGAVTQGLSRCGSALLLTLLALFLASPHTETLPRLLWEHLQQTITPVIAAVATLVLLFTLVLMAAVSLLRRSDTQAA